MKGKNSNSIIEIEETPVQSISAPLMRMASANDFQQLREKESEADLIFAANHSKKKPKLTSLGVK